MTLDQGPTDCCTQRCNQVRNCPARCTVINTCNGGGQIDTDESLFDWVAALLIGTLFFFGFLADVGAVMAAFYIFWG